LGTPLKILPTVSSNHVPDPNRIEAKIAIEPKDPEQAPEQDNNPGTKTPSSDTTGAKNCRISLQTYLIMG